MLFVSHDRQFLSALSNRELEVKPGGGADHYRVGRVVCRQDGPRGQRLREFQGAPRWRLAKDAAARMAESVVVAGRGDHCRGGDGWEGDGLLLRGADVGDRTVAVDLARRAAITAVLEHVRGVAGPRSCSEGRRCRTGPSSRPHRPS